MRFLPLSDIELNQYAYLFYFIFIIMKLVPEDLASLGFYSYNNKFNNLNITYCLLKYVHKYLRFTFNSEVMQFYARN